MVVFVEVVSRIVLEYTTVSTPAAILEIRKMYSLLVWLPAHPVLATVVGHVWQPADGFVLPGTALHEQ
jgi:hypothetical protein